jgi:hypothetical protein
MEEKRCIQGFVGKPDGKRLLGSSSRRWENISISLKRNQIEESGLERFGSGYGHVAGCYEHVNEPLGFVNCWEFLD